MSAEFLAKVKRWWVASKWLHWLLFAALLALLLAFALVPTWGKLGDVFAVRPLALVSLVGCACLLAWVVIYRKFDVSSWGEEYRDFGLIVAVVFTGLIGGTWLVGAVSTFADPTLQPSAYRTASLWAMAYFSTGFIVGFLFGIPRVLQGQDVTPRADGGAAGQQVEYAQRVNTNLEQISDWLTKIIVGLGLVELRQVPEHLYRASLWMAQSFSLKRGEDLTQAASFSNSVIIFFSIVGFLAGYLITRLYLAGAFRRADTRAESEFLKDAARDKLRKFWMPDDKNADPVNERRLLEILKTSGIISSDKPVSIPRFVNGSEYAEQRKEIVKALGL